jgi:glycosyl transferase family 2
MKFTVIIPTRERCDTLVAALRTCTQQRYDRLEIIVSDNVSTDRTAEVVKSFGDSRIRYVNPGRRMAMTGNWEFALSHVEEGYVTIIGDDDGLLPGAIPELARLMTELGRPPVLGWTKAVYHWPDFFDVNLRNMMTVPLSSTVERYDSRAALAELMRFQRPYGHLPGLYNSIVDIQLIRDIASKSGGAFFHSSSPDVYSSVALTAALDSFHFSWRPYGIGGQSSHSTGSSNLKAGKHQQAFDQFMSEGNIPFHSELTMAPSLPIIVAESYLQARDHYAPRLADYELVRTLEAAMTVAAVGTEPSYHRIVEAVRHIASHHHRPALATDLEQRHPHQAANYEMELGWNPLRRIIAVRADAFAAHDVYEASLLARHLLTTHQLDYFGLSGVFRTTVNAGFRSALRRITALAPTRTKT